MSSLAPQAARSTTSDAPQHLALEDAVVGWHSGGLFADSMGEDAIEVSGGRQSLVLGDAFSSALVSQTASAVPRFISSPALHSTMSRSSSLIWNQCVPGFLISKPRQPGFDARVRSAEEPILRSRYRIVRNGRARRARSRSLSFIRRRHSDHDSHLRGRGCSRSICAGLPSAGAWNLTFVPTRSK